MNNGWVERECWVSLLLSDSIRESRPSDAGDKRRYTRIANYYVCATRMNLPEGNLLSCCTRHSEKPACIILSQENMYYVALCILL